MRDFPNNSLYLLNFNVLVEELVSISYESIIKVRGLVIETNLVFLVSF